MIFILQKFTRLTRKKMQNHPNILIHFRFFQDPPQFISFFMSRQAYATTHYVHQHVTVTFTYTALEFWLSDSLLRQICLFSWHKPHSHFATCSLWCFTFLVRLRWVLCMLITLLNKKEEEKQVERKRHHFCRDLSLVLSWEDKKVIKISKKNNRPNW